jgi:hypothetical protein
MQSFIHRKNLENFRRQLAETNDDEKRLRLQELLAEEEANEPLARQRGDGSRQPPRPLRE